MCNMTTRIAAATILLAAVSCRNSAQADRKASAQTQTQAQAQAQTHTPIVDAAPPSEVELLIGKLRSPNRDPNPNRDPTRDFPATFDHVAQKQVGRAYEALVAKGKAAFPTLIDHADDKGYSLSVHSAVLLGLSVGEVCKTIIEQQVDLAGMTYKSRSGADGAWHPHRSYFSQYLRGASSRTKGLRHWWSKQGHLPLKQMQVTALRWAIEREREIGFRAPPDKKVYLDPLLAKLKQLTSISSESSKRASP